MSRAAKIFARLNERTSLSFVELIYLAEALGFICIRQRGSHRIYRHMVSGRQLNLQPSGKDAKPYQCDQLRAIIAEQDLHLGD